MDTYFPRITGNTIVKRLCSLRDEIVGRGLSNRGLRCQEVYNNWSSKERQYTGQTWSEQGYSTKAKIFLMDAMLKEATSAWKTSEIHGY